MVWTCCEKDNAWLKICMEYEVEGSTPRGRPIKEDLERGCEKNCQARKLNKQDAMS